MQIDATFGMTATLDILEALAAGDGPAQALLALGYSGWGPGQLESEILSNGWLIADAVADVVFSANDAGKWAAVLPAPMRACLPTVSRGPWGVS
jgi:putative transcriptional regulator